MCAFECGYEDPDRSTGYFTLAPVFMRRVSDVACSLAGA